MKRSSNVLATICARGGSKGVPGKNIRLLKGKPLILYAIDSARACSRVGKIVISTDSDEIALVVEGYHTEVPFRRPAELATDTAPKVLAIRHATLFAEKYLDFISDIVVDLDVGAPLRSSEDIASCIRMLENNPELDAAVTVYEAERNPYFNMVEFDGDFIRLVKPGCSVFARQLAPKVYSVSGSVFAWRRDSLIALSSKHLFEGRWGGCVIPRERAIDIDAELDLMFVEYLLSRESSPK